MNLENIGVAGFALSVQESTAVKCSLLVLANTIGSKTQFWGKVTGMSGDYLIAQNVPQDVCATRQSFYSVDGGTNWVPLPTLTQDQIDFCEQLRGRFIGNPSFQYKLRKDIPVEEEAAINVPPPVSTEAADAENDEVAEDEKEEGDAAAEAAPEAEEAEGEDQKAKKKKPKFQIISLAESCRLSRFVSVQDSACRLAVRGSFLLKEDTVVKNRTFNGLDVPQALKPSSYLKLHGGRAEKDVLVRNYAQHYNGTTDFLVPITEDRPEGVWTVKHDPALAIVTVQNLLFEGSLFWLKTNSSEYGQVYFGTGEINLDLCFMLP
jgi:radial spoke head protein 9